MGGQNWIMDVTSGISLANVYVEREPIAAMYCYGVELTAIR